MRKIELHGQTKTSLYNSIFGKIKHKFHEWSSSSFSWFKCHIKVDTPLSVMVVITRIQRYWLTLSRSPLCRTLLSGFDDHGLWLNSLLLKVSLPSVYGIFKRILSDCQKPEDAAHRWRLHVEQKRIHSKTNSHQARSTSPANRQNYISKDFVAFKICC